MRISIPVVIAGMLFSSCNDKPEGNGKVDFDRKAMLTNWADNILMPGYTDFEHKVDMFHHSADDLAAQETQASLTLCRQRFEEAWLAFQRIKAFEVGPAENISFRAMVNTYPADTGKILNNGAGTSYDLNSSTNTDAKGFPALDYLLFAKHDQLLQDDNLQLYLTRVIDNIHHQIRTVLAEWNGSYRDQFINASGTDIGSSLGQIVNSVNKDYELIKNAKIGFPAGKKSLGQVFPEACEAFYGGFSVDLAMENLTAIHNFYRGLHYDGSQIGLSLQDYLQEVQVESGNTPLDQAIDNQFQSATNALLQVPDPLSDAVVNHKPEVDSAYLEIQKNVILLKTDMPSALGVLITYQDNDGD